MRPIHKFILHVVHNWTNELNEAYSEGAVKKFIEKFREEADDLNINITDEQLKTYIQRFDVLKNSPKITEKDLNKYSVGQLIRLVTSSPGAETPEDEEDQTPDVVYQDGGITIWNGSKEDNCITYGRGEKWCITRGSFGTYRYDSSKGYPTFYLAKNANMSTSDKLSFVAIQVRDVDDENKKYVYTNRQNSPYESSPMSFSKLMSEVPWLNDIPNIRGILRYIPLSSQEKASKIYGKDTISIREWIKLPFNVKKQYLVARKTSSGSLFSDISREEFINNYLPKYPEIANFIAITPGLIKPEFLLKGLDKFSNQDRRSITANLHNPIDIEYLSTDTLSFDVKKLLTVLKKWNIPSDERIYLTKDGNTIVKLKFGDDISVSLYQAEDDYPNIKLNKRTSKYLLDYPELDQLPFNSLLKLASDNIIDKEFITKVIEKAKSEENSAIVVKKIEGGEILIDSNSFTSYKIAGDKITKVPFNDEEVQKALGDEKENTSFQQGVVNIIKTSAETGRSIPPSIDKDSFISILKSTPYDKRKFTNTNNKQYVVLTPDGESDYTFFTRGTSDDDKLDLYTSQDYGRGGDWRTLNSRDRMQEGDWRAYFAYLRNENQVYSGDEIIRMFRNTYSNASAKQAFIRAQPPMSPTDRYATAVGANNVYYLINKANPRESFKISDTGKLVKANIPASAARQLIGATPDEATPAVAGAQPAAVGAPRRGRPVGGGQPRAAAPAAPAVGGVAAGTTSERMAEYGLTQGYESLPRATFRRLSGIATEVPTANSRGASRRNNLLGGTGRVIRTLEVGASSIYIIRLTNGSTIASINIQPGNGHYVVTRNGSFTLNSPANLLTVLRQRGLAEARRYFVQEYLSRNPHHIDEVRSLLQQHINEFKNR